MTKILIGCPVFDRAWILPEWIRCIEAQNFPMEDLGFVFELGPDDDPTHDVLWEWQVRSPYFSVFDAQVFLPVHHESHPDGFRVWSSMKYYNMVTLRNNLLERATSFSNQFDYYFSLDSDILLSDPETLNRLVFHAKDEERAVISPLMYMTPYDTDYPSAMSWIGRPGGRATRSLNRYRLGEVFEADIVMAAVFMQKQTYTNVRYQWHRQGEDLGFATSLAEHGLKSFAAWDIYCPHIMHKDMLEGYLKTRSDPRKPS